MCPGQAGHLAARGIGVTPKGPPLHRAFTHERAPGERFCPGGTRGGSLEQPHLGLFTVWQLRGRVLSTRFTVSTPSRYPVPPFAPRPPRDNHRVTAFTKA